MIRSNSFPTDSPEYTLMEFLHAWRKGKCKRMAVYCQKTWLARRPDPTQALNLMFNEATLETAEIIDVDLTVNVSNEELGIKLEGGLVCDILISMKVNGVTHARTVRLIKESGPHQPSEDGEWGVNPLSVMREMKKDV